jgi:hypothetical protein
MFRAAFLELFGEIVSKELVKREILEKRSEIFSGRRRCLSCGTYVYHCGANFVCNLHKGLVEVPQYGCRIGRGRIRRGYRQYKNEQRRDEKLDTGTRGHQLFSFLQKSFEKIK